MDFCQVSYRCGLLKVGKYDVGPSVQRIPACVVSAMTCFVKVNVLPLVDLSTLMEEDESKTITETSTKQPKRKSSTVIKLKEKESTETTLYSDLSHEDKGNVLTDLLVKSTISYALEKQRKVRICF